MTSSFVPSMSAIFRQVMKPFVALLALAFVVMTFVLFGMTLGEVLVRLIDVQSRMAVERMATMYE